MMGRYPTHLGHLRPYLDGGVTELVDNIVAFLLCLLLGLLVPYITYMCLYRYSASQLIEQFGSYFAG